MKILVTGAAGFLGGRLGKALASQTDHEVTGTSRRSHRQAEFEALGIRFVAGDLTEQAFCRSIVQGQEVIIHCAALSSPWGSYQAFYSANVLATKYLADAAKQGGVQRFLNISTPSIYFNFGDQWGVTEATPLPKKSVNQYAATKLEAEQYVLAQHTERFATLSLRPRAIIGAEDQVIFPRLIRAYEEGRLRIIGKGDNLASLTSMPNLIQAIQAAIEAPLSGYGQVYNICDPEPIQLWEDINFVLTSMGKVPVSRHLPYGVGMFAATVSETIARLRGGKKEPTLTRYGIGILARNFTMNPYLAQAQLGYDPPVSTREGLQEFLDWYQLTTS
ncbi:MAG: NAD-dependent epimerase/dehydratase family protein [Bacteroidota bacterium]